MRAQTVWLKRRKRNESETKTGDFAFEEKEVFVLFFFILLFFPYWKKLELKGKEKEIKNLLFIIIIK